MGPAEKQHLKDLLNFYQTYSLHAIGLPESQLVIQLNSVSSRKILIKNNTNPDFSIFYEKITKNNCREF